LIDFTNFKTYVWSESKILLFSNFSFVNPMISKTILFVKIFLFVFLIDNYCICIPILNFRKL